MASSRSSKKVSVADMANRQKWGAVGGWGSRAQRTGQGVHLFILSTIVTRRTLTTRECYKMHRYWGKDGKSSWK